MSYINDPREMAIRPESGVTLEQDNRIETMYHWGAMVTDLCDLPVSEYMKPMTVIVLGSGGGEWLDRCRLADAHRPLQQSAAFCRQLSQAFEPGRGRTLS